jgi:fluoride exporter
MNFVAVGLGAAIGAWLRWGLGLWLADAHDKVQLGTLAANLGGGYLIGIALGFLPPTRISRPNGACSPSPASWAG